MSKKTTNDVVETVDTSIETSAIPVDTTEPAAYLVKEDDGYHVEDLNGNLSDSCSITKDGEWIILPENASNRKCVKVSVAERNIADTTKMPLYYKATRVLGSTGGTSTKLPNEKLIAYLPEAEQEEYRAIIARAIQARDAEREANKKKPMTEAEKAMAKVNKIIAQLKDMGVPQERIDAILAEAKAKVENKEVENND